MRRDEEGLLESRLSSERERERERKRERAIACHHEVM